MTITWTLNTLHVVTLLGFRSYLPHFADGEPLVSSGLKATMHTHVLTCICNCSWKLHHQMVGKGFQELMTAAPGHLEALGCTFILPVLSRD